MTRTSRKAHSQHLRELRVIRCLYKRRLSEPWRYAGGYADPPLQKSQILAINLGRSDRRKENYCSPLKHRLLPPTLLSISVSDTKQNMVPTTNLTNKTNGLALETEKSVESVQSVFINQTNTDDSDSTDIGVRLVKVSKRRKNTDGGVSPRVMIRQQRKPRRGDRDQR
jgi:hypothetical protein